MSAGLRDRKLLPAIALIVTPMVLPALTEQARASTVTSLSPVGAVPEMPAGSTAAGPIAPRTRLQITVVLRSAHRAELEAKAAAVSTPGSPEFRHFLTSQQIAEEFGPAPGALAAVESYLSDRGLTVAPPVAGGLVVSASGPASAVTGALHTGIMQFRQRNGRLTYANSAPPSLPSDIAPQVATIQGLDDTVQLQPHIAHIATTTSTSSASQATHNTNPPTSVVAGAAAPCTAATTAAVAANAYTSDQLAAAYGFNLVYGARDLGQGVTVGVFELVGYSPGDVKKFKTCYGLKTSVKKVAVSGGTPIGPDTVEAELDIDTIIGLAPRAKVRVFVAPPTTAGILAAYGAMETDTNVTVVSTSWGSCEPLTDSSLYQAEDVIFAEMIARGQTVLAASGDTGSEDCFGQSRSDILAVDDPASQPDVTGVGGTDLTSLGPPSSETAWNDGSGASGGGISSLWSTPSWQTGTGVTNQFSNGRREVPDVSASASADNGYIEYCTTGSLCKEFGNGWFSVGGTSAAAPLWAALIALTDKGVPAGLGNINPLLYQFGSTSGDQNAFNDVTTGNNDYTGSRHGLYPATAAYDMATGWGTPNAPRLVNLLRAG